MRETLLGGGGGRVPLRRSGATGGVGGGAPPARPRPEGFRGPDRGCEAVNWGTLGRRLE